MIVTRFSFCTNLVTLFFVLIPAFCLPTLAQMSDTTTTNQTPLTEAEKTTMQERAKTLIERLNRGEYSKAREVLAPNFANQITTKQLQTLWEDSTNKLGKVNQQVSSRVVDTVNSDLVVIETIFERGKGDIIITFNENEQIIGVNLPEVETISEISEIFVKSLAANDFPRARGYLHPLLKTEIFPQQVQQQWDSLQRANGKFKRITNTEVRPGATVNDSDVVLMTLEFEKGTREVLMIFDSNRRIIGVNLFQ